MIFIVTMALFAAGAAGGNVGDYGEYIWPSYIISLVTLGALAFFSWRRKRTLETRLKNLETQNKQT